MEYIVNNRKYIGKSINIEKRFKSHIKSLNKEKHKNIFLQKSWNNNGFSSFNFFIIEECSENNLNKKEIFYIKNLNTKSPNGYNLTNGGEGVSGYTHNEERRKK